MSTAASPSRPMSRTAVAAGVGIAMLAAAAIVLWARYGTAVFHEMIVAGLALCF